MQVAIIGLGRMGKNIVFHLLDGGVSVIAYNRSRDDVDEVVEKGAIGVYHLSEVPQKFTEKSFDFIHSEHGQTAQDKPVVVILYIPAGAPVDEVLFGAKASLSLNESDSTREKVQSGLVDLLPAGSVIIDGGNSFYKDSQKRYGELKNKGFRFLDMGTSGGLEGARNGACLMVGGDEDVYKQVEPILAKIAVKDGYGYFGPSGAGHFVKMIHNGIEYAVVQAFAEGFEILHKGPFILDLAKVAHVYSHGSIIRGLIVELLAKALKKDPTLASLEGQIGGGETGVWTYQVAKELHVAVPAIKAALLARKNSQTNPSFGNKVISALRREWGEHGEGMLHPLLEALEIADLLM